MATARILDYGVGNIHSLTKALERSGLQVELAEAADGPGQADAIVLPGVGAWGPAAKALEPAREAVLDAVDDGRPLLGICLGMQLLGRASDEGIGSGLGIVPAQVETLHHERLPQIGWNTVESPETGPLSALSGHHVYYVNSYALPADAPGVAATTTYGDPFAAIIHRDTVLATQFHPEKSSHAGRLVLDAFADIVEGRA